MLFGGFAICGRDLWVVVCLGMCICVLEGGSLDVRETGTALHAGEEGGDEDCVEGEVG